MINLLQNLHDEFAASINAQGVYLKIDPNAPAGLSQTAEKLAHLYEVFRHVKEKLENEPDQFDNQEQVTQALERMRLLQNDTTNFYRKYSEKTDTWRRWLLKQIPVFLRMWFPRIFDHGIERAEENTAHAHTELGTLIGRRITVLSDLRIPVRPPQPVPRQPVLDPVIPEFNPEAMQASSLEKHQSYLAKKELQTKQELINILMHLNNLTKNEWEKALKNVFSLTQSLPESQREDALRSANVPEPLIPLFIDPEQKMDRLIESLANTLWGELYSQACQSEIITFKGISRLGDLTLLNLSNKEDQKINFNQLVYYQGQMRVKSSSLIDYAQLLSSVPTCQPSHLEIEFDVGMTEEFFQLVIELKKTIPSLTLSHLTHLDLRNLNATPEQEKYILENITSFYLPDLKQFNLGKNDKSQYPAEIFSNLLRALPNPLLMNECLEACSSPKEIIFPSELKEAASLSLNGAPDLADHLIKQWSSLETIKLGKEIKEKQISGWISQGYFQRVKNLDLSACSLTTDILFALSALPSLRSLKLPELTAGAIALYKLPKFEDPFKIKQFYTQAALTRPFVHALYTGLPIWAALFEIPLARHGYARAIAPHHHVLDPYSITYWLYQNDYRHLAPQNGVFSIVADECEYINDGNLVEFVSKFPYAKEISLYNCQNISSEGILHLAAACPRIEKIDCSSCPNITDAMLDGLADILRQRPSLQLDISGTSVSAEEIEKLNNNKQITYCSQRLKISNEQLEDEGALEKILLSQNLSNLRHLDLSGCTNLTNQALGLLLDRLNTDEIIVIGDGLQTVKNHQRLNLLTLNLSGCTHISKKAFHAEPSVEGKIQPKILNTLKQISLGGTMLWHEMQEEDQYDPLAVFYEEDSIEEEEEDGDILQATPQVKTGATLQDLFPSIEFTHAPITFAHHVDLSESDATIDPLHLRISQELFAKEASVSFEIGDVQKLDLFLDGMNNDKVQESYPRILCYAYSGYLRKQMRDGTMNQVESLSIENVNATTNASRALFGMMQGKDVVSSLDWKTAYQTAELAKALELPLAERELLSKRTQSLFSTTRADEMLLKSRMLEDYAAIQYFENQLCDLADARFAAFKISLYEIQPDEAEIQFITLRDYYRNICEAHALSKLSNKLNSWQAEYTKKLNEITALRLNEELHEFDLI